MTELVKAPDIRVVKSAAKALRAKASDTVKISHSMALEIAANAFGFTNWHACRSHFKHIEDQVFSIDAIQDELISFGEVGTEICDIAIRTDLTFTLGDVTAETISAIRSPQLAVDILALGAASLTPIDARAQEHWDHEGPAYLFKGEKVFVAGSWSATSARIIKPDNILACFKSGIALVAETAIKGDVSVSRVSDLARKSLGNSRLIVPEEAIERIGKRAQVEMNLKQAAAWGRELDDKLKSLFNT